MDCAAISYRHARSDDMFAPYSRPPFPSFPLHLPSFFSRFFLLTGVEHQRPPLDVVRGGARNAFDKVEPSKTEGIVAK